MQGKGTSACRVSLRVPDGTSAMRDAQSASFMSRVPHTVLKRGVVARAQQIFRTKAESQRIVATRPLCRVQYPVPYSSRLQGIHRAGSGNCDGSKFGSCDTVAHGFPRAVDRFPSGMDSNLEAFSYNPTHGSFGASPYRAAPIPMVRIGGSSRTEPNYR